MSEIRTRQTRTLRSTNIGELHIQTTYIDRPASIETWIEHCGALAIEFGMPPLAVMQGLFAQLPEIFGA